ncbi:uncharacterized protein LOC141850682 isoform X2 [Brevipalpus obovatus]|uniref:uncharacterized protein LOC141850682 isoform X2 n=1 Tax=Brevipalpus obovatus TaxID=246614 RepID=UPI003D9F4B24
MFVNLRIFVSLFLILFINSYIALAYRHRAYYQHGRGRRPHARTWFHMSMPDFDPDKVINHFANTFMNPNNPGPWNPMEPFRPLFESRFDFDPSFDHHHPPPHTYGGGVSVTVGAGAGRWKPWHRHHSTSTFTSTGNRFGGSSSGSGAGSGSSSGSGSGSRCSGTKGGRKCQRPGQRFNWGRPKPYYPSNGYGWPYRPLDQHPPHDPQLPDAFPDFHEHSGHDEHCTHKPGKKGLATTTTTENPKRIDGQTTESTKSVVTKANKPSTTPSQSEDDSQDVKPENSEGSKRGRPVTSTTPKPAIGQQDTFDSSIVGADKPASPSLYVPMIGDGNDDGEGSSTTRNGYTSSTTSSPSSDPSSDQNGSASEAPSSPSIMDASESTPLPPSSTSTPASDSGFSSEVNPDEANEMDKGSDNNGKDLESSSEKTVMNGEDISGSSVTPPASSTGAPETSGDNGVSSEVNNGDDKSDSDDPKENTDGLDERGGDESGINLVKSTGSSSTTTTTTTQQPAAMYSDFDNLTGSNGGVSSGESDIVPNEKARLTMDNGEVKSDERMGKKEFTREEFVKQLFAMDSQELRKMTERLGIQIRE